MIDKRLVISYLLTVDSQLLAVAGFAHEPIAYTHRLPIFTLATI